MDVLRDEYGIDVPHLQQHDNKVYFNKEKHS